MDTSVLVILEENPSPAMPGSFTMTFLTPPSIESSAVKGSFLTENREDVFLPDFASSNISHLESNADSVNHNNVDIIVPVCLRNSGLDISGVAAPVEPVITFSSSTELQCSDDLRQCFSVMLGSTEYHSDELMATAPIVEDDDVIKNSVPVILSVEIKLDLNLTGQVEDMHLTNVSPVQTGNVNPTEVLLEMPFLYGNVLTVLDQKEDPCSMPSQLGLSEEHTLSLSLPLPLSLPPSTCKSPQTVQRVWDRLCVIKHKPSSITFWDNTSNSRTDQNTFTNESSDSRYSSSEDEAVSLKLPQCRNFLVPDELRRTVYTSPQAEPPACSPSLNAGSEAEQTSSRECTAGSRRAVNQSLGNNNNTLGTPHRGKCLSQDRSSVPCSISIGPRINTKKTAVSSY